MTDTKMTRRRFFNLLHAGLWGEQANQPLFDNGISVDWIMIFKLACEQAVTALLMDGINTLPACLRPPHSLLVQWTAETHRTEQTNEQINLELATLNSCYQAAGLAPILIKGQGIATAYLRPDHRQGSDIDFLLAPADYADANQLLLSQGATPYANPSICHTSYTLHNLRITHRRVIARLNCPRANKYFQQLVDQWDAQQLRTAIITDTATLLPPASFDALYLFIHLFTHFLHTGIAVRQLCDWVCLLHTEQKHIDSAKLTQQLEELGLLTAAQVFGYIAVAHLKLPTKQFPIDLEGVREAGEELLDEILQTDKQDDEESRGNWSKKYHTFIRTLHRYRLLKQWAPTEINWYPLEEIKRSFIRK